MSARAFTVSVPCKPYLKKFAQTICKTQDIPLNRQTSLGIFTLYCLTKNMYENRQLNTKSPTYNGMTDKLTFVLNEWQFQRIGFNIPSEDVISINSFIDELFEDALLIYIVGYKKNEPLKERCYQDIYKEFCQRYGIVLGEDIEYDAMTKKGYRVRVCVPKQNPLHELFN